MWWYVVICFYFCGTSYSWINCAFVVFLDYFRVVGCLATCHTTLVGWRPACTQTNLLCDSVLQATRIIYISHYCRPLASTVMGMRLALALPTRPRTMTSCGALTATRHQAAARYVHSASLSHASLLTRFSLASVMLLIGSLWHRSCAKLMWHNCSRQASIAGIVYG